MPDLPCVGIARAAGLRLKALCQAGPVRVWLRARAENSWRPLTMTSAEFGARRGRQFVLLGGHMDSWPGPQATDNAAGTACIMELSRVFHRRRDELRRGIVTGLWMGHETGTMVSSARFADVHWDHLRDACVAYLQIDQPAIVGASTWRLNSTDDIRSYAVRVIREARWRRAAIPGHENRPRGLFSEETVGEMPMHWRRLRKNGDTSFFGVGLPCFAGQMSYTEEEIQRTALANLGWWHHSLENTIDKVDKHLLALHLQVYARSLWGLLTEPVLPYEYRPLAARFVDRLRELARLDVPEIDVAGAVERAEEFQRLATRLDELSTGWRERASVGDDGEQAAGTLNRTMIRLFRVLVPVASTVVGPYGQDRYGHPWQTQMIPSLTPYPALADYARDSEAFQTWWVAMIRARNRVVDALKQGSDAVRAALAELS